MVTPDYQVVRTDVPTPGGKALITEEGTEPDHVYDIFAYLIATSWLSRSSPEAAGELLTLSCSLHAAAGELRDNQDIVIEHANMS